MAGCPIYPEELITEFQTLASEQILCLDLGERSDFGQLAQVDLFRVTDDGKQFRLGLDFLFVKLFK